LEEYSFYEGKRPDGYQLAFHSSVFHGEDYLALRPGNDRISFYILNEKNRQISCHIHFYRRKTVAHSTIQSPFGSFEFSPHLPAMVLYDFIEFIIIRLKASLFSTILITHPPQLYEPTQAAWVHTFLLNHGFQVYLAEIASLVPVSDKKFETVIHPRKKRKLKQSEMIGFEFRLLESRFVDDVYHFILRCRDEKNFKLSVSLDDLKKAQTALPNVYILFGVYHRDLLVAASVAVRVNDKILYHFISDHIRKVEEAKPVLILMRGIYNYCSANQVQLLDLGTSALNAQPNFKLLKFKTELGGVATEKFTFVKDI
jgi:hypothetical protein